MRAAELINLMVNLVVYPSFIIVHTIVSQCVINIVLTQPVNNLEKAILIIGRKKKKKKPKP